ncbi:hypothetical protein, partial [Marivivens donghaensis]|uniref:hypothetical protein n=1 Tax=Marivivens donghaensis TaxID=1699413 RepID=UPI001C379314
IVMPRSRRPTAMEWNVKAMAPSAPWQRCNRRGIVAPLAESMRLQPLERDPTDFLLVPRQDKVGTLDRRLLWCDVERNRRQIERPLASLRVKPARIGVAKPDVWKFAKCFVRPANLKAIVKSGQCGLHVCSK